MKKITLLFATLFITVSSKSQSFQWAKQLAGTGTFNVQIHELIPISTGDVIIAGEFSGQVDFDTSTNVFNKTAQGIDGFVARYDDGGNLIWAYTTDESGNESIKAATLTVGSNFQLRVVTAIQIENNAFKMYSINQQTGAFHLASPTYTSTGSVAINAINKDFTTAQTSYYVAGSFTGSLTIGTIIRTSFGQKDAFCTRFTTSSNTSLYNLNWFTQFGGTENDEAFDINNNSGFVTLVGSFEGTAELDGTTATSLTKSAIGGSDAFAIRLNDNTGEVFTLNNILAFGGVDNDAITSIDKNSSTHQFGGYFSDSMELVPSDPSTNIISTGLRDGFVAQFSYSGSSSGFSYNWANGVGTNLDDSVQDISLGTSIYYAMQYGFNGTGTQVLIGSFANNGAFTSFGGIFNTPNTNTLNYPTAIGALPTGELFTAGIFNVATDFNPATAIATLNPIVGGNNSFFQKMGLCNSIADTPTIAISKTTACLNELITLNISSASRLKNNNNWVWYADGCAGNYIGMGKSITIPASYSTTFYVRAEGGCVANGSCSNSLGLTVNPIPANGISLNSGVLSVVENSAIYQWLDCNNGNTSILGANQQSFTPIISGNYACLITNAFDCSVTTSCLTVTLLNNQDFSKLGIKMYPNPVKNTLTIEGQVTVQKLSVYNLLGQKVREFNNSNKYNIEDLNSGTYLVEVTTEKGTAHTKIVKE